MLHRITNEGISRVVSILCSTYMVFYLIQVMYSSHKPLPDPIQEWVEEYINTAEYRMNRIGDLAEKVRRDCTVMDKKNQKKYLAVVVRRGEERLDLDSTTNILGFFLGPEAQGSIAEFIAFDAENENPCAAGAPTKKDYKNKKNAVMDTLDTLMQKYRESNLRS